MYMQIWWNINQAKVILTRLVSKWFELYDWFELCDREVMHSFILWFSNLVVLFGVDKGVEDFSVYNVLNSLLFPALVSALSATKD